jgi:hypothetical protein
MKNMPAARIAAPSIMPANGIELDRLSRSVVRAAAPIADSG